MSPKMGRPLKDNPRNVNLNLRLTSSESAKIKHCSEVLNISRTDAIMRGIELLEVELLNK